MSETEQADIVSVIRRARRPLDGRDELDARATLRWMAVTACLNSRVVTPDFLFRTADAVVRYAMTGRPYEDERP